ncbi:MAG: UPF0149 family protein [Gammaproteobacteria bacterium]
MHESDYESILHQWLGRVTTSEMAEMDGFICGLIARRAPPEQLFDLLFADESATEEELHQCTVAMNLRYQQLADFSDLFVPLIVDDDQPLSAQAASLATWCYGFLATLGDQQELRDQLSDEGLESLQDLLSISQIATDEIDDEEENAFVEVFEYVRVAASMVLADLAPPPPDDDEPILH